VSSKVLDCPVWLDRLATKLLAVKRTDRLATAEEAHRTMVNAKRKVASGMGATQQQWSGLKGALTSEQDQSEIRRLRRIRPKEKDTSPIYERAWFLALCLITIIGLGIWALMPLSEDALFARAKPLMDSESSSDWQKAEDLYLESFRERFPKSKYADQLAEFDRRVAIDRAETRLNNNKRLNRDPQSEAERQFGDAQEYEQFGDRLTAWKKYEALVNLFAESKDKYDIAFVALARRQIDRIQTEQDPAESQTEFLEEQLKRARALAESGKLIEAKKVLEGIITLYGNNQEARPLVERARDEKRRLDTSEH
jgi:eukaryotic-like serine/threonine-protein kinase